jgi:hypothetical protein
MQHFPETSIPWMNPAAEVQNFAVLFSFHKFQGFDPLSMNGLAMNQSRQIHPGCTHAQEAVRGTAVFLRILDCFPT